MDVGRLRDRITIQVRADTAQGSGQRKPTWAAWKTVWAEKRVTAGTASDEFGAVQHVSAVKFYIRKLAGITAEMRVLHKGRVYELTGPPVDWADGRGLTLLARERE